MQDSALIPDPNAGTAPQDAKWSVWRTDDTGNTFLVRENLSHEEATRLVAEFEARGHKQTYFAEQQST
jgi:hypothetical protein